MPKVSIVIPLYRITELFYQCMESLKKCSPECEVIVIRADGSFAENCNRGIAAASGDYICLLNDDCVVTEGWLSPLVRILDENPKAGAVSPMMLYPNGRVQFGGMVFHSDYCGGHLGWGWAADDPRLIKVPTQFQATTFGCVLLRKEALKSIMAVDGLHLIGKLDETFIYKRSDERFLDDSYKIGGYEDIDWCVRAKLKGWEIWYQPESRIYHYENATFMSMPPEQRWKASIENRKTFLSLWKSFFDDGTFKVDDMDYPGGKVNCFLCGHSMEDHIEDGKDKPCHCGCLSYKVGFN